MSIWLGYAIASREKIKHSNIAQNISIMML